MKAAQGRLRSRFRRACAAGLLVMLAAALSGCVGTPAASSAGYCDEHPNSNRC